METPSSMRKVPTSATSNKNTCMLLMSMGKNGEAERGKGQSERRSALLDITNDSPIVGLAVEALGTPIAASMSKKNSAKVKQTPGSGEALLRGQVKNLLQKIEEEGGELLKPLDHRNPAARFQCLSGSPALRFLAPTPANTPLVGNLSDNSAIDEIPESTHEAGIDMKQEVDIDLLVSPLTRALLFDSPGKSDISSASIISSELTYEGSLKSPDEDSSSVWSIQANASTNDDDDDADRKSDKEGEISEDDYEEEEDCDELDELCSGMSRICMEEKRAPEFGGRHTRFMYNSDDEIEGEEEVVASVSPNVLRLRGMPTPKGKHLRFPQGEIGETP